MKAYDKTKRHFWILFWKEKALLLNGGNGSSDTILKLGLGELGSRPPDQAEIGLLGARPPGDPLAHLGLSLLPFF